MKGYSLGVQLSMLLGGLNLAMPYTSDSAALWEHTMVILLCRYITVHGWTADRTDVAKLTDKFVRRSLKGSVCCVKNTNRKIIGLRNLTSPKDYRQRPVQADRQRDREIDRRVEGETKQSWHMTSNETHLCGRVSCNVIIGQTHQRVYMALERLGRQ